MVTPDSKIDSIDGDEKSERLRPVSSKAYAALGELGLDGYGEVDGRDEYSFIHIVDVSVVDASDEEAILLEADPSYPDIEHGIGVEEVMSRTTFQYTGAVSPYE